GIAAPHGERGAAARPAEPERSDRGSVTVIHRAPLPVWRLRFRVAWWGVEAGAAAKGRRDTLGRKARRTRKHALRAIRRRTRRTRNRLRGLGRRALLVSTRHER